MHQGAPYYYDYINAYNGTRSPSTVHCKNTALSQYFQKYLLEKILGVYKFTMPKYWAKNYALYVLFCWGYFAVFNTDKFGVIPQGCGLQGYDVFYQPTHAIITNPLLTGIINPRIGVQCELVKLQPNYSGVMDIVTYYADMLALCAEAAGMNLVNSKLSFVFFAKNQNSANSYKKMYDLMMSGDTAVFADKMLLDDEGNPTWQMFNQNVGQNFIANDVLEAMRKIEQMFDTDVGIPNANTDKKERLIVDEVNANNIETQTKTALWLESIKEGCEKVNAMFPGTNLQVEWRAEDVNQANSIRNGDVRLGQYTAG